MFRYYDRKSEKRACHPWVWNALAIAAVMIVALVLFLPKQKGNQNSGVRYIYLEEVLATNYTESTTTIDLTDLYVNGTIPSMSWCNFKQLSILKLGFNYLHGTIPSELGNCLPNLTELHLGGNYLSGTIPTTLGLLSKLTSLRLQGNHITGTIPSELESLTKLEYLSLSDNWISGNLPTDLYALKNLKELRVDRNMLSGTVPKTLDQMSTLLQGVLLYGNIDLTGDVGILCSGNHSNTTVTIDLSMSNVTCECCSKVSRDEFGSFNYYLVG
jgi:Leucine-rich repeat (LRR) protein